MGKETPIRKKSTKTPANKRKTPVPKKKSTTRAKRRKPWSHVHCTLFLLGISLLLTVFIGMTLYLFILLDIPNLKSIKDYQPKTATLVLDRDHKIFKRKYEENRRLVTLAMMPGLLPKAFIAAEDARFYQHPGVDIWSIFRAFFHNIRAGATGGRAAAPSLSRSLGLCFFREKRCIPVKLRRQFLRTG